MYLGLWTLAPLFLPWKIIKNILVAYNAVMNAVNTAITKMNMLPGVPAE